MGKAWFVGLACALAPFSAMAAEQAGEALEARLAAEVRQSLAAVESAPSFHDWEASSAYPSRVLDRAELAASPGAGEAMCRVLGRLEPVDLALFHAELDRPERDLILPCRQELAARVERYYRDAALELAIEEGQPEASALPIQVIEKKVSASATPILRHADLGRGQFALTFDDGPHASLTSKLLDILKSDGVKATFFQVGRNAKAYPAIARKVKDAGHSVGSHSQTHANLTGISAAGARGEITIGHQSVGNAVGGAEPFFRFPFGNHSRALDAFVKGEGMVNFLWNMDTRDWAIRDPKALLAKVKAEIEREGRGILLFHDIQPQTIAVMPHVLELFRARGYAAVLFKD